MFYFTLLIQGGARKNYITFVFNLSMIYKSVLFKIAQARLKLDILGLYGSLLVGSCPCHGFTKVDGHTGGFYHIVCRHGERMLFHDI